MKSTQSTLATETAPVTLPGKLLRLSVRSLVRRFFTKFVLIAALALVHLLVGSVSVHAKDANTVIVLDDPEVVGSVNEKLQCTGHFQKSDGTPLRRKQLFLYIDGQVIRKESNDSGNFRFAFTSTRPGSFQGRIEYHGERGLLRSQSGVTFIAETPVNIQFIGKQVEFPRNGTIIVRFQWRVTDAVSGWPIAGAKILTQRQVANGNFLSNGFGGGSDGNGVVITGGSAAPEEYGSVVTFRAITTSSVFFGTSAPVTIILK